MRYGKFSKQPSEEYVIAANFANNMDIVGGEDLDLPSCTVTAVDSEGTDATVTVTDQGTLSKGAGDEQGYLKILIKAGVVANSPYQLTFLGVTTSTPAETWEKDIIMTIKEL